MRLKWTRDPFNQKLDAYIDWIGETGDDFPPGYDEYIVPAVWLVRPESEAVISEEEPSFNINILLEIFGEEFFNYVSPIYSSYGISEDMIVFTTHIPLGYWRGVVETLRGSELINKLDYQIIMGRPLPADARCEVGETNPKITAAPPEETKPEKTSIGETNPRRQAVVVGVIDEGLAFANERFRNDPTRSRVEFAWLQDGKCHPAGVPKFNYGRELTKWNRTVDGAELPGIDSMLERSRQGGLVDEDLFYSLAGVADFSRRGHKAAAWRVSHGAHVMDVAAGCDMEEADRQRHIVCVQLPTAIVADTSGLGLEKFLMDGVTYIFDRAEEISERYHDGADLPVVINFSSGVRAGPHDGTSYLERSLDRLISSRRVPQPNGGYNGPPTQLVLPAGNSFHGRSHACFSFKNKTDPDGEKVKKVDWHVPPDDRTFSYIELWLPDGLRKDEVKQIGLTISAPGTKEISGPLFANPENADSGSITLKDRDNGGSVVCRAYFQNVPAELSAGCGEPNVFTGRGRFLIALAPTAFHDTGATLAPAGIWSISLSYGGSEDIDIHGWIHWDDSPINYVRFGRQSFFEDPYYEKFADDGELQEKDDDRSVIRRTGTINAIATGAETRVVGGYRKSDGRAARYTSADFKGLDEKPDYLAVSEMSNAYLGILAAGTRSGSAVALNGTSVAAPQVTRVIAELMAQRMTDTEIQAHLDRKAGADDDDLNDRGEDRNPDREPQVQMERLGEGRLILPDSRPSNALRGEFGS